MTPKEKAEEILNRFKGTHVLLVKNTKGKLVLPYKSGFISNQVSINQSKYSAIFCVDEIIKEYDSITSEGVNIQFILSKIDYWEEVKKELESIIT